MEILEELDKIELEDWTIELSFSCRPLGVGKVGGFGPSGSKLAKDETEKLKISKKVKIEKLRNKERFLKDWKRKVEFVKFDLDDFGILVLNSKIKNVCKYIYKL